MLFDLDGTLVDTEAIRSLRERRQWKECVASFSRTIAFPGMVEAVTGLKAKGVRIAVVTSSVSYYAANLLDFHRISYDVLTAYHDTRMRKPHPEPFLHAAEKLGVNVDEVVGIGDGEEDATACKNAGIRCFGAGWSMSTIRDAYWTAILDHPSDIDAVSS